MTRLSSLNNISGRQGISRRHLLSTLPLRFLATSSSDIIGELLNKLSKLDTSSLCDADKSILAKKDISHVGLKLLDGRLKSLNHIDEPKTMVGIARTVQLVQRNDFLAVLRGLNESQAGDVLVVNTLSSTRAVAGELFCAEAQRRGLSGIIIDGPARDTAHLQNYSVRFYATSKTPYSGTIQSVGKLQEVIECGDVQIHPGDIIVGDCDGIVAGSADTFQNILPLAQTIQDAEEVLRERIVSGTSLASMTNLDEHLKRRLKGEESSLEFRI